MEARTPTARQFDRPYLTAPSRKARQPAAMAVVGNRCRGSLLEPMMSLGLDAFSPGRDVTSMGVLVGPSTKVLGYRTASVGGLSKENSKPVVASSTFNPRYFANANSTATPFDFSHPGNRAMASQVNNASISRFMTTSDRRGVMAMGVSPSMPCARSMSAGEMTSCPNFPWKKSRAASNAGKLNWGIPRIGPARYVFMKISLNSSTIPNDPRHPRFEPCFYLGTVALGQVQSRRVPTTHGRNELARPSVLFIDDASESLPHRSRHPRGREPCQRIATHEPEGQHLVRQVQVRRAACGGAGTGGDTWTDAVPTLPHRLQEPGGLGSGIPHLCICQ